MNKELDDFLYRRELEKYTEEARVDRLLRNGYCPNCYGMNLKKSRKFWIMGVKYTCKDCGFTFEY